MKQQQINAYIAATRFGIGARKNEIEKIAANPSTYLLNQLDEPVAKRNVDKKASSILAQSMTKRIRKDKSKKKANRKAMRQIFAYDVAETVKLNLNTSAPLQERFIDFWMNHFTVSVGKKQLVSFIGRYESDAIRANFMGTFADMLLAVTQHPAMLIYLDNVQSIGPNTKAGKRRKRGLNENLAREILELHTLGVNGGYNQKDVTEFAKVLTGWSLNRKLQKAGKGINYQFDNAKHEPGSKFILGKRIAEGGESEGKLVLKMLARHPSTARHIAYKLAQYFVADNPPALLVKKLEKSFTASQGNLRSLYITLLTSPEIWDQPANKIKRPDYYVISAMYLMDIMPSPKKIQQALSLLNFKPYAAPSPAGWSNNSAHWASPDAIYKRVEWAFAVAQRLGRGISQGATLNTSPQELMHSSLGPIVSADTAFAIKSAADKKQALALLLASPEFQRR